MLYTTQNLPLSLISLEDWQLVKVSGIDNNKFLQGQLTADITQLTETRWLLSAHCDPKGKTLSHLLLFKHDNEIYYITRRSVAETQMNALKKYAIFSKVTIEPDSSQTIIGIAGQHINSLKLAYLTQLDEQNNCITHNKITFLRINFPQPRYIVIGPSEKIITLTSELDLPLLPSQQWSTLNLQANFPIIDIAVSGQFLPQAFNLQHFEAISFKKGCYCGQEMVARAQYRGINKRALFLLQGIGRELPKVGDSLEQKIGDNWRETGCILACYCLADNIIWVQAILNNDMTEDELQFRTKHNHQLLSIINT